MHKRTFLCKLIETIFKLVAIILKAVITLSNCNKNNTMTTVTIQSLKGTTKIS